jgi:hypothetical protein
MPTRRFSLSKGQPTDLEVSWRADGKDLLARFQGSPLSRVEGSGTYFKLPDGSDVSIEILGGKVVAVRNGEFLPGTAFDPAIKVRIAVITLAVLAAIHLSAVALPVTRSFPFPQDLPLVVPTIFLGAIYTVLAWWAWQRSKAAMMAGIALTLVEGVLFAVGWMLAGYIRKPIYSFAPALLLYEGLEGLKQLEADDRPVPLVPR